MTVEELIAAMQAVIDSAKNDDGTERDLTDEEASRYEDLEKQLQTRRRTEEIQKRNAAYTAVSTKPITGTKGKGDDTLERAWMHYMRTGQENQDIAQLRAQSTLVGSEGGYLVPEIFRDKIVERMVAFGGLAENVENITTDSGAPMRWATLDDTANLGEIVPENQAPVTGADLVFGEANLGAYKYMAVGKDALPLRLSVELVQDAGFDVEAKVANWLGERIARKLAVDIVRGSGVGEPQGIVTGKTGVQTAANNALTYADLLRWVHSVDPAYREGAKWAFNDSFLATVQGLVDLNGRPLLVDANNGIENNPGGQKLLGYPVVIDQAFANFTNNSPTVNFGVFGDLDEAYVLRKVKDVTLVVDPYTRAINGQVQYTAWMRADGVQQNPAAYVALTGKS